MYLSYLVDMIVHKMPFNFGQSDSKDNKLIKKRTFINRRKFVEIGGIKLAMNMNEKDYNFAYN